MSNPLSRLAAIILTTVICMPAAFADDKLLNQFEWNEVNSGTGVTWSPRAGLQAVNHKGKFIVLGGRTPKMMPLAFGDSIFHNDVWRSKDSGKTWDQVTGGHGAPWDARAYFQAVTKGPYVYVIGGQDSTAKASMNPTCIGIPLPPGVPCPQYVLESKFFNDVWRSRDGVDWQQMTNDAAWSERAGLSAVTHRGWLYVMGGSVNDDSAVIGPGGIPRKYYNDVYRSRDGRRWHKVTNEAPWAARAGAVVVSRGAYMYVLGGEDGFVCNPSTPRCPPYFNDVWKSKDGRNWTQVTAAAGWSPRPGHQCEIVFGHFICFGGFGLSDDPFDPFKPSNPTDIWVSKNAADWIELSGSASPPWNAEGPEDIKYDFAAFSVYQANGRFQPSIFTFGGDRETFNPGDFLSFLKVDNDVWQLTIDFSKIRWE